MGILTNALNQLTTSVIGMGVDQLDAWFTRMAEKGLAKEAAAALDNQIAQQHNPYMDYATGQQALQSPRGGGILPEINGQPTDFGNVQALQPQSGMGLPQYSENYEAFLNPYTGQLMTNLGYQEMQNDPRVAAAELARKQQEAIINASGSAAGTLGGKGNIGNYDIGPYVMGSQRYSPQDIWGNAAQGAALVEEAKGPEWQRRHDISVADQIRLKQTPGARAMGSGGGDGGAVNTIGTGFKASVVKSLTTNYKSIFPITPLKDAEGKTVIGDNGQPVYTAPPDAYKLASEIADEYSKTKKPNYIKIETQAVSRYRSERSKDAQSFSEFSGQKPTAIQNLPRPQPTNAPKTTPLPTALPNVAPKPQPKQAPTQSMTSPTALSTIQKIAAARAKGIPDERIKQALIEEGKNPADYGF